MIEIVTVQDITNFLGFPFITEWNGATFSQVTFTFFNLCDGTTQSETASLKENFQKMAIENVTFSQILNLITANERLNITNLLAQVIQTSRLYKSSLHKLQLTFMQSATDNEPLILERYFVIPHIELTNPYPCSVILSTSDFTLTYAYSYEQATVSNLTKLANFCVVRTRWSDVLLHEQDHIGSYTGIATTNIAGFDMHQVFVFSVGTLLDSQIKELSGYNSTDLSMILVPHVELVHEDTVVKNNQKQIGIHFTITSPVFNGIDYDDYGFMFYNNGMKINVQSSEQSDVPVLNFDINTGK